MAYWLYRLYAIYAVNGCRNNTSCVTCALCTGIEVFNINMLVGFLVPRNKNWGGCSGFRCMKDRIIGYKSGNFFIEIFKGTAQSSCNEFRKYIIHFYAGDARLI